MAYVSAGTLDLIAQLKQQMIELQKETYRPSEGPNS